MPSSRQSWGLALYHPWCQAPEFSPSAAKLVGFTAV